MCIRDSRKEGAVEGRLDNLGEVVTRQPYRKVRLDHLLSCLLYTSREVVNAVVRLIDNDIEDKETTIDELIDVVKGPDFPTGGIILGTSGIKEAYSCLLYTSRCV